MFKGIGKAALACEYPPDVERRIMFKVGDLVQPKKGGPKLEVLDIQGDEVICTPANILSGDKVTLKVSEVTLYKEDGDFGVC
jgi:hypothetical protein